MSIDTLKRTNSLDKLLGAVKEENAPQDKKSYKDERLWKPELDKSGNGFAVIRFLPSVEGEDMPWAKVWNHAFQGPTGQWYIENSLTTIGQKDPVSEMNSSYWNTGLESDKEIARKQKRKLQYFSNIYVVSDSKHPENEGKVFLFRKVDGYWNYDKSEFDSPTALFDNDGQIEEVWKKAYPLAEKTDASNFKSYEELKQRLDTVLSGTISVGNVTNSMTEDRPIASPVVDTTPVEAPIVAAEEDDTMSYFEKLANNG